MDKAAIGFVYLRAVIVHLRNIGVQNFGSRHLMVHQTQKGLKSDGSDFLFRLVYTDHIVKKIGTVEIFKSS